MYVTMFRGGRMGGCALLLDGIWLQTFVTVLPQNDIKLPPTCTRHTRPNLRAPLPEKKRFPATLDVLHLTHTRVEHDAYRVWGSLWIPHGLAPAALATLPNTDIALRVTCATTPRGIIIPSRDTGTRCEQHLPGTSTALLPRCFSVYQASRFVGIFYHLRRSSYVHCCRAAIPDITGYSTLYVYRIFLRCSAQLSTGGPHLFILIFGLFQHMHFVLSRHAVHRCLPATRTRPHMTTSGILPNQRHLHALPA